MGYGETGEAGADDEYVSMDGVGVTVECRRRRRCC